MPESSPTSGTGLVGQVLSNTYRVEGLLGKGGMGAVYAAAHLRLPTRVAVKVLHAEAASNPEIFARFRREAEITSALRHPNIVQVLDFNHLPDGTPYLVMEYLDGEDLHQRLRKRGRLTYEEVVPLLRAIGGALMAAHKREVVHRDLKPQNIFLARTEQDDEIVEVPKIVDFGISKIRHANTDTQRTQDQQLLGTPNYMSPEQARGDNSNVDSRTDQWALAAIVYQCLTGRLAFAGENLASIIYQVVLSEPVPVREFCPEVPECAEAAIRRALSKKREDRFPSVLEFVRAFSGQVGQEKPEKSDHPRINTPQTPIGQAAWQGTGPGHTIPLSTGQGSMPGSLDAAKGQVNPDGRGKAWRWGLGAFVAIAGLLFGGVTLYRRMPGPKPLPSPVAPKRVDVPPPVPPPAPVEAVDAAAPPDLHPAAPAETKPEGVAPRVEPPHGGDEKHRHGDKNRNHHARPADDAEDVDINLSPAR